MLQKNNRKSRFCYSYQLSIGLFVYSSHRTSARLIQIPESNIPRQRFCCGACHTGNTGYGACCTFTGEMLFKDTAIIVFFFILWRVDREAFGSMFHLLIAHSSSCDFPQSVNPSISYTVTELLFLSPRHTFR